MSLLEKPTPPTLSADITSAEAFTASLAQIEDYGRKIDAFIAQEDERDAQCTAAAYGYDVEALALEEYIASNGLSAAVVNKRRAKMFARALEIAEARAASNAEAA